MEFRLEENEGVVDAQKLASFRGGDAGVRGQTVEMIEAVARRRRGKRGAAKLHEALLESEKIGAGLGIAWRNGAASAGMASLQLNFADTKAHHAVLLRAKKLIFPKRRDAIDFQRSAKTQAYVTGSQAREPSSHGVERCGRNNRRAAGDRLVGKTFRGIAHGDGLLEISAEPLCCVARVPWEGKRFRRKPAAIAGNGKRHGAEVRRIRGANQVHRSGALTVDPLAVLRIERPDAVELQAAAWPDPRLFHGNGIERLDGMQANAGEMRVCAVCGHCKILAEARR